MAQWDVYENPSPRSRDELPYFVEVQSNLLARLPTRFVVPWAPRTAEQGLPKRMSPQFDIAGRKLLLVPQEAGPIEARNLRRPVATLRAQSHLIVDALDSVVSGV
ncbi:MAG: CcdB family protein [Burkholderiaceae bacterium]|nr:CcdB family protein [Burkholderiaceae bacterium]